MVVKTCRRQRAGVSLRGDLCYDSWSLSHLGYLYPGTTPVMIKLDHNRSCPWVYIAQVTKAPTITDLGKAHATEKYELRKLLHQARQKTVTDAIDSSAPNASQQKSLPHSMWDLLRRYKTDHMLSNLPAQAHDNSSPDAWIWKLGPLTLDPQAWHWFRYALGHHLLQHAQSPYDEAAAHRVTTSEKQTLHRVEHPILPIDPLFH